jgi:branched-chain amino acid transport system ATP-binding protein
MSPPLLTVEAVTAGYQPDLPIITDVGLTVAPGELVTIIGPNGAGKSTLIKAIAGLLRITGGRVLMAGEDIANRPTHRMAEAGIAYVPQSENIFASLTVDENLRVGAHVLDRGAARAAIAQAYRGFPDLLPYRTRRAGVLSGGQRQMLAVARALLTAPRLIMLDEPSAGLAPKVVEAVFTSLSALARSGVAVLMVEQNAKAAMAISDRTYVLAEGRNRLDGRSADLIGDPAVAEIYLGRAGRKH